MTTHLQTNPYAFTINERLREKHVGRIEVLERIKALLLLPNLEIATTKQVAEFYNEHVRRSPFPEIHSLTSRYVRKCVHNR
ncbi:hypothetical protein [Bacillus mycoides]|uniref:hypothetical protein n=1 Tax=Bacillus mycoides TaxID=1405 RepID=UPI0011A67281|nr:hypothetical protein [Bacillus mycoides]